MIKVLKKEKGTIVFYFVTTQTSLINLHGYYLLFRFICLKKNNHVIKSQLAGSH